MSNINNISSNNPLQTNNFIDNRARPEARDPSASTPTVQPNRSDEIELSPAARRLSALSGDENAVRPEAVERVRGEIADGTYLSDAKLDTALDALIDRVIAEG